MVENLKVRLQQLIRLIPQNTLINKTVVETYKHCVKMIDEELNKPKMEISIGLLPLMGFENTYNDGVRMEYCLHVKANLVVRVTKLLDRKTISVELISIKDAKTMDEIEHILGIVEHHQLVSLVALLKL